MLILSIAFFTIAVLLGALLASYVLTNKNTPKAVAFIHGAFAVAGLVLLILYLLISNTFISWLPFLSLGLFVLAALGGGLLIYKDLTGKPIPKLVVVGHGTAALAGLIILVYFMLKYII